MRERWDWGHAAVNGEGGDKSDMDVVAREALGELEGRVDVALSRERYQQHAAALVTGVIHNGRRLTKELWLISEICSAKYLSDVCSYLLKKIALFPLKILYFYAI